MQYRMGNLSIEDNAKLFVWGFVMDLMNVQTIFFLEPEIWKT